MNQSQLVGISEIADMVSPPVTKQAVANWRHRFDDFPRPVQTLQSGPVWDAEIVGEWLKARAGQAPIVLSFINLKGGVAKTTTSVAVAEILAKEHRKHVLFIDLDPQTNATVNLIGEEEWKKRDAEGRTLSQLFKDKLRPESPPKFDIEQSIVRSVSRQSMAESLGSDLLPSSIEFIDIQEKLSVRRPAGQLRQQSARHPTEGPCPRYRPLRFRDHRLPAESGHRHKERASVFLHIT